MEKIKVTQRQRDNAIEALTRMWPSVPKKNVAHRLSNWRDDSSEGPATCKTVACFGGWCAVYPTFQEQGVRVGTIGSPWMKGRQWPSQVADRLFGDERLFLERNFHPADKDFSGTDHALVTNRLRWLLDNSVVKGRKA